MSTGDKHNLENSGYGPDPEEIEKLMQDFIRSLDLNSLSDFTADREGLLDVGDTQDQYPTLRCSYEFEADDSSE